MDAKVPPREGVGELGSEERQRTRIQAINREIILEAALEIFSVNGFRGSTVDQIAARAAMSKPNLLYYFRRKQDIYRAVLERTLNDWLAPLAAVNPQGEPVEELRRYITEKLRMSAERPAASRLFANEILAGAPVVGGFLEVRLKELVDQKAAVIGDWISRGLLAPVDPHHLIFMIWATTQHYADFDVQVRAILGAQVDGEGFGEHVAQAILTVVLNGIKPR